MAAMTSFHAEKCCHLMSAHTVYAQHRCNSVSQFLIYSTFILVVLQINLFLSVWIQLIQLFPALMHSDYVRQYSTVRFCAVSENRLIAG